MNWTAVRDSSRALRWGRSLVAGSVLTTVTRPLRAAVQSDGPPPRFDEVIRVVDDSRLLAAVSWLPARVANGSRGSFGGAVVSRVTTGFMILQRPQRIRLAALMLMTATLVHLGLAGFSAPAPAWVARATWLTMFVFLAIVMAGARQIDVAWTEWRRRRSGRGE